MPNPITCRIAAGKLLDLAAERLSTDERAPLERHLATCVACRQQAADYRRLVALMTEAGQAPLPASRADWQMLAARMEETAAARGNAMVRRSSHLRLGLACALGVLMLGIVLAASKPERHVKRTEVSVQPRKTIPQRFAELPDLETPRARVHGGMFRRVNPRIALSKDALGHGAAGGSSRAFAIHPTAPVHHHPHLPTDETAEVRRLLARAAKKIDALERRQEHDASPLQAMLQGQGTMRLERKPASVQITVMTPNRTLLDSHTAFQPSGAAGGTWVRQTLQEQPDGNRTTETVAAIFSPDRPDSFLTLQTCSTPRRRLEGEPQP